MKIDKYDFIIVGQGLAGSVLSYLLLKKNKKILVIDKLDENSSSQVAAGLVNPVTGRRVVKSWMADVLIPFAEEFYKNIEKERRAKFYFQKDVVEVIHTIKDLNEWTSRMAADDMKKYFTNEASDDLYKNKIQEYKKLIRIGYSAWMNIPLFINNIKNILEEKNSIRKEKFDLQNLIIDKNKITYEDITAEKLIFCEGVHSLENDLWKWLPLLPAKGEILTVECTDFPEDYILLSGIFMIPLGKHKFRIGSTYEWNFKDALPTEDGKSKLITLIDKFIKVPYQVIDHRAGIRPTVKDRRPLIGKHPDYENVFVFNGMGTKGVVLAPFFADQFVKYLLGNEELMEEVNVNRFKN